MYWATRGILRPCRQPPRQEDAMHPLLEQVDWEQEGAAVVDLLGALLRFDTTNPPGNEAECVAFLADHLRGAGVEPEVLSPAPGRANLVARLPGGDGGAAPLLLNGHVDVVAAEAGRWRHPPFAGEVHDGVLWGRGAVDMKQMVAMSAIVVGLLARLGVPLRRDLKLAAVADEEAGSAAPAARRSPCCFIGAGPSWSCGAGCATPGWPGCWRPCSATPPPRPWSGPATRSTSSPAGPRPSSTAGSRSAPARPSSWPSCAPWPAPTSSWSCSPRAAPDGQPARRRA